RITATAISSAPRNAAELVLLPADDDRGLWVATTSCPHGWQSGPRSGHGGGGHGGGAGGGPRVGRSRGRRACRAVRSRSRSTACSTSRNVRGWRAPWDQARSTSCARNPGSPDLGRSEPFPSGCPARPREASTLLPRSPLPCGSLARVSADQRGL